MYFFLNLNEKPEEEETFETKRIRVKLDNLHEKLSYILFYITILMDFSR